jgi:hypothetical protein
MPGKLWDKIMISGPGNNLLAYIDILLNNLKSSSIVTYGFKNKGKDILFIRGNYSHKKKKGP